VTTHSSVQTRLSLRSVVVDLTPLLPGGENGGAKVVAMELVREMARLAGNCHFKLLTSESSHGDLKVLDAENVERVCVSGAGAGGAGMEHTNGFSGRLRSAAARALPEGMLRLAQKAQAYLADRTIRSSRLRDWKADLLFCPFTAPFFYDEQIPVVSLIHDLQHRYYPQFFHPEELKQRDLHFRRACRLADRLICVSDYVRWTIREQSDVAPDRVTTIHTAIQHRLPDPLPSRVRAVLEEHKLEAGRFLLYPANFWLHKNHEMLLIAFGMYLNKHRDGNLKLVLTGEAGARMNYLREATRHLGLADRVVFAGYVSEADISALLESAKALIFPSLFEGFGISVVEAMAAGRPVLCSDVTSLPEVAGDAARYFDPRRPAEILRAIEEIEAASDLEEDLIARGNRRVEQIGRPEDMAARYLEEFEDVVCGRSARGAA